MALSAVTSNLRPYSVDLWCRPVAMLAMLMLNAACDDVPNDEVDRVIRTIDPPGSVSARISGSSSASLVVGSLLTKTLCDDGFYVRSCIQYDEFLELPEESFLPIDVVFDVKPDHVDLLCVSDSLFDTRSLVVECNRRLSEASSNFE